jgi:hypothetical protein
VEEGVVESNEGMDEGGAMGGTDGGAMGGTDGGAGAVAVLEKTGIYDGDSGGRTYRSVIGDDEDDAEIGEAEDEKRDRKVEIALDAGTEGDEGETGTEGET